MVFTTQPDPSPGTGQLAAARPLDEVLIVQQLRALGARWGTPLSLLAETASTNDDARRAARGGVVHGAAFVADAQHAGRGRGDHHWHSPAGCNIYLSLLLRPRLAPAAVAPLTLVVGLAVADVVDRCLGRPCAQLKWPNDVLIRDKKVAGILLESSVRAATRGERQAGDKAAQARLSLVVGVGLNVLQHTFPTPLAAAATSLLLAGGEGLSRERIVAQLIAAIERRCERFFAAGLEASLADFSQRDVLQGKQVRVGECRGVACGIDPQGQLLICDEAGYCHALRSGEVSWNAAGRLV